MVKNILSIDVEEIFHGEYTNSFKGTIEYRSPFNIPILLELLREKDIIATFFIVGEIAERFPEIVKMISKEGHEISFHGWSHTPLWRLDPSSLEDEILRFKKIYPNVIGYRAPSFSLDQENIWALRVLEKTGIKYDSSLFPVKTPLYGVSKAPLFPFKPSKETLTTVNPDGKIIEFPLTVYSFLGLRIPAAGGFYLRLMPSLVHRAIRRYNNKGLPAVIYVHNWELDSAIPRLNLGLLGSLVTYHNIEKTIKNFQALLSDFDFISFKEYLTLQDLL